MDMAPDQIRTFEELTESQRAVAWAVVRSIATALWAGLFAAVLAWALVMGRSGELAVGVGTTALLIGAAALCGVMELKARDLEKRDVAPEPEADQAPGAS